MDLCSSTRAWVLDALPYTEGLECAEGSRGWRISAYNLLVGVADAPSRYDLADDRQMEWGRSVATHFFSSRM